MTNDLLAAVIIKGMWPYGESVSPHYKDTAYDCVLAALQEKEQQMIEKAIGWIDYNNRNGGCWFDGWEEDFKRAMMEEL